MVLQGENIVSGGSSLQIGTRFVFTGNTSPIGCMLCDGRALSRTNYAVLFSVIGTIYGSGDGSTTFNIPDYSAEPETWYIKVSNYGILPVNAIDDTQITNANTFSAEYINNKTQTLRYNANFTLPTFLDGTRVRLANTHATNTITCTLPTGQTMNGQSSFTIIAGKILELELIGSVWVDTNNDYYSTTEQIIGTWIDGKPIYRRVIPSSVSTTTGTYTFTLNQGNIKNIFKVFGIGTVGTFLPFETVVLSTTTTTTEFRVYNQDGWPNIPYFILEYTKTTD